MNNKRVPAKGGSASGGKTLFSGIKPTGHLQLGNYLGAIVNWVELQKEYECIFSIVDLHALTIEIEPAVLKQNTFDLAVDLLASGLDPKKSIIFKQSEVVGHSELAWIFNCLTPVAELNRMTQFKDQSQSQPQNVNAGLLTYPTLQAADILLYRAEIVPVGQDQLQHLELSRIIAKKFNNRYGQFFSEIKPIVSDARKIMSLKYSDKKMSKSHGEQSYIALRDEPEAIAKKIKKAVADEEGVKNLLKLYTYFGDRAKHQEMYSRYKAGELMNAQLKEELTTAIVEYLAPIQAKIKYYNDHPKDVNKMLTDGAKKAQTIADKNLDKIKKIIGLK